MSWSPCPICGGPLEAYPGSPCTSPMCINSRATREREAPRYIVPLTGQVTREKNDEVDAKRRVKRKAARAARKRNRRAA